MHYTFVLHTICTFHPFVLPPSAGDDYRPISTSLKFGSPGVKCVYVCLYQDTDLLENREVFEMQLATQPAVPIVTTLNVTDVYILNKVS